MARMMLEPVKGNPHSEQKSSGPRSEGEAARQLLDQHGYPARLSTPRNGQHEFKCPFHEEPGSLGRTERTNFYVDAKSSQYYCQSATCGESGNLQTLQKFFGIAADPTLAAQFKGKDTKLSEFQGYLTTDKRHVLYEKGLTDTIIDRFRLGWDAQQSCYVIPYLENRRPVAFRFYDPVVRGTDEKGRPVYGGPNGSKYWWERASDTVHQDDEVLRLFNSCDGVGDANGRVFITEGEFKAMLLVANGCKAVSVPGVMSFKHEWAQYFMNARQVVVVMDNDSPAHHQRENCRKCGTVDKLDCAGHNPGQEGAARIADFFGHRAKNVVLPLPAGMPKTDINEFMTRDGHTFMDFMQTVDGKKSSPFLVRSLAEIRQEPPAETVFLVDGVLPRSGRLLVTGAPKVGKSILLENLALSIAAGIPFLHRFAIANDNPTPGHRVLLLDRELSHRSLFDRLNTLIDKRPGYGIADDKLLIDHEFSLRLDAENAGPQLVNLINVNAAEVIMLDTAYKFFSGDMESSTSVKKAFDALDFAIRETGVSVVLTHHHRKSKNDRGQQEAPSADQVVGSFLWTGWPNGTVLLNFKERSVSNPYDAVCSFAAFRDCAAPDPLLLRRTKTSIHYEQIEGFSFEDLGDDDQATPSSYSRTHAPKLALNPDNVANVLLETVPCIEDEFLHAAAARFGAKPETVRIFLLDIMDNNKDFVRSGTGQRGDPYRWAYSFDAVEETYDASPASPGIQEELGVMT